MADIRQTVCDQCGLVKKDSNHWWSIQVGDGCLVIGPWKPSVIIIDRLDLCGEACVMAVVSQYLSEKLANQLDKQ